MVTLRPNDYDQMYRDFKAAGADWPVERLRGAMAFLMASGYRPDANWGAIDAIADLIRGLSAAEPLDGLPV